MKVLHDGDIKVEKGRGYAERGVRRNTAADPTTQQPYPLAVPTFTMSSTPYNREEVQRSLREK